MLKRQDGAEDVVQEAFARLAASPEAIEDVRGWLVVVTRRLCLDRLDRAESRRTTATAEPPAAAGGAPDPADRVVVHDEVGQALSVVVDRLSPAERTSFILHDVVGFRSTRWPGWSRAPRRHAGSWPAALAYRSGPARIPPS
jgi:RNA polymerase sigma-70 factor, ECF subfamily